MNSKTPNGYYHSTILDIVLWEKKMGIKNNLSFDWTNEFKMVHNDKIESKKNDVVVQCKANAIDPFPVAHYRQCQNKTRNSNGLCYIHQLIDKNVTIKYWKN